MFPHWFVVNFFKYMKNKIKIKHIYIKKVVGKKNKRPPLATESI